MSRKTLLQVVAIAFVTGVVGGILVEVLTRGVGWSPQYGDWATWATALVAVPAIYFGINAFREQRADLDGLRRREALRDQLLWYQVHRAQKDQARLVTLVVGTTHEADEGQRTATHPLLWARVENDSGDPVTAVTCRFLLQGQVLEAARARWAQQVEMPRQTWVWLPEPIGMPVVTHGCDSRALVFDVQITNEQLKGSGNAEAVVQFTDELGTRWERRSDGELKIVAERPGRAV